MIDLLVLQLVIFVQLADLPGRRQEPKICVAQISRFQSLQVFCLDNLVGTGHIFYIYI